MPGAVGIKSKLIAYVRPPSRTSSPLSDEGHAEFGEACPRYAAHGRRKAKPQSKTLIRCSCQALTENSERGKTSRPKTAASLGEEENEAGPDCHRASTIESSAHSETRRGSSFTALSPLVNVKTSKTSGRCFTLRLHACRTADATT